ncbi:hypothetical protein [Anditalea andensis]|uniref:Uncharacterized protein n=1 Tax=Anditalea andensis TaxID=1048983 RepID=A0A074L7V8_9BACT|nr:hypothetical protein [Anditalea andensis]KEO75938.1 hypothetical protein EL17_00040 [Anditalea andensis]
MNIKKSVLNRITVLVEMSPGDVRAIFATTTPRNGYMNIYPDDTISNDLIQKVAGYGMETVDRDEILPNWQNK